MNRIDFHLHNLHHFSPDEIESTGSQLFEVQVETIIALNRWRESIGRRVYFQPNGITTGNHRSREHALGLAVDVYLDGRDGQTDNWALIRAYMFKAVEAGFCGIGIYWNSRQYSFHLDLGAIRLWAGVKPAESAEWCYKTLLVDPRTYL